MCVCVCVCVRSLQSCPTLCDPIDCSPSCPWDSPGKNTGVNALLQGIFHSGMEPTSPALAGGFFYHPCHLESLEEELKTHIGEGL